jgi:hypothetical protein
MAKRTRHGYVSFIGNKAQQKISVFTLTSSDITTLHSVPVSLIGAPGVNKAIEIDKFILEFTAGTVQYTGGGAVNPVYHGATTALAGSVAAATITGASNAVVFNDAAGGPVTMPLNTGIDLYAATADFAAGNGTAIVTIWYTTYETGA